MENHAKNARKTMNGKVKKRNVLSTSEGTECWSIANCILCKSSDSNKCVLCATGSIPFENKCICEDDDKILIDGNCVL